ncbi:hypothetical protein EB796_013552 [Bugula neritina]|uniref:Uncharacterized protein n=1 Tax=Bugula neritina TaxID=10212 RepID=A0A7J7JRS7_BUGNE|nr:hypothetical protein EB796_013552 [Bugula neritina]
MAASTINRSSDGRINNQSKTEDSSNDNIPLSMSGESKDKLPASGRPMIAQPQATWPMPANMTDFPAWQWQPVNWQQMAAMAYSGMSYLHPGAGLPGVLHQPPMPAHTSVTVASTNPSPRAKDDSVKVVKPKDPQMRVASSSAGIQSPKPNGPGFLLGAQHRRGGLGVLSLHIPVR